MSPPLHPEFLLSHAGALRSMARALLRDEHAAEDVVQETWLRALIAPPNPDGGVGGWLRSVAQGFAQQHRRAEGRRAQRERIYAAERCEALDADQRSAVLRAVMEAVLALDEPYRETVLLRWFEGLPPRAIAARLGVQVATVDSRLQRAHARLRARLRARLERELGREPRGWRGLVALALGAPRRAPIVPALVLPLIGVAVSLKVVGAALAAIVGVCLWVGWDRAQPENVDLASVPAVAAPSGESSTLEGAPVDEARVVVPSADPVAAPEAPARVERPAALPPGPYTFALEVEVVDASERPVHGAEIFLGPASCSVVSLGETGWDGRLVREWRGFEPTFEGVLFAHVDGRETSLRRVVLTTGTRHALRFQSDPSMAAQHLSGLMRVRLDEVRAHEFAVRFTASAVPRADAFELDAAGNGVFVDSNLVRACAVAAPTAETEESGAPGRRAKVAALELNATGFLLSVEAAARAPAGPEPERATVRGVVHDENGRPITDLIVGGRTPERWNTGVLCDADGAFVFENVPPGPMEVCVGGGERAFVREVLELAPGETRFLELRPMPRTTLRLRLHDEESAPLAQWRIEARGTGPDAPLLGVATTDENGAAVLGLVAGGSLVLLARPQDKSGAPAVVVGQCTSAQTDELLLKLPHEARNGSIAFTVEDPLSDRTAARAWRVDTGEGLMLRTARDFKVALGGAGLPTDVLALTTGSVSPGRWRIELRAPGRAWTEVGEFDLAPGQKLELGRVMLPASASVKLATAATETSAQLSVRTQVDGALVLWPERLVDVPVMLETLPDFPLEILRRAAGVEDRPATLPLSEALRPRAGREIVVELPGSR